MYYKPGLQTIRCKILELREGEYKHLVVQDLETEKYLMVTIFPNWQEMSPKRGDMGYLEFEFAEAGVSKYYEQHEDRMVKYNHTYLVFKKFIADTSKDFAEDGKIIL